MEPMMDMAPLDVFEGLSKSDLKNIASNTINNVLEKGNPLEVAEALAAMETFIKEVRTDKRFTDYVREEAAKTPKVFISNSGAKIELAEVGTHYDFTNCGDLEREGLRLQKEGIELQLKQREEFLKQIPLSGLIITDEQTGETVTVYPPTKISTSSYKVTLSK